MPNQPVQVVTNPRRLQGERHKTPPTKAGQDFYENEDEAFSRHRLALLRSLTSIWETISSRTWQERNGTYGHIKVTMIPRAIAKTHRPQKSVFTTTWTPHVATEGIGEPIFAVTSVSLGHIIDRVKSAPDDVPVALDPRTGLMKPKPSRLRCELSAIASVDLWTATDKRAFSGAEGSDWLNRPGTGGSYLIEMFPLASASMDPTLKREQQVAARSLAASLSRLSIDARARPSLGKGASALVSLKVLPSGARAHIELGLLSEPAGTAIASTSAPSDQSSIHDDALALLDRSALVRKITLPPALEHMQTAACVTDELLTPGLPPRGDGPVSRVGVIDGGVSDVIDEWLEDSWGQVAEEDRNTEHGTFISGLLVAAGELNPAYLKEFSTGCAIIDVDVLPADPGATGVPFDKYYPAGVPDFMDEVDSAVKDLRSRLGVRVFNFSMNFTTPGDSSRYGYAAQRLDQIGQDNDVLFVVSAGNLPPVDQRSEWSGTPNDNLATLASETRGLISEPAESLYNMSVSALNPPGLDSQVDFALARYSRRGPGLHGATKPDFAHIGGSGTPDRTHGHGLISINSSGEQVTGAGTSYAAPLVARHLADLDALIEDEVPREVLLALMVHHSSMPAPFTDSSMREMARNLAGFGVPPSAEEVLLGPDSEITLVVHNTILPKEEHVLEFSWPESLVENGKCRGYARLTLVARPVLAYEHGDERIRVNIDAKLMQQQNGGGYGNGLKPVNMPSSKNREQAKTEKDLLKEALKWQVVKCFEAKLAGRGPSSNWKLLVEYLTRAEEQMPTTGVEFAAVLTIGDNDRSAPVFQQMRQHLGDLGVRTGDIRTSIQTRIDT